MLARQEIHRDLTIQLLEQCRKLPFVNINRRHSIAVLNKSDLVYDLLKNIYLEHSYYKFSVNI